MTEILYGKEELISVEKALPNNNYTITMLFSNGETRLYNARELLEKPVFKALNSKVFFLTAKAMYGTVVWNDDIDLDPEYLYENSILV
ncbi:MAG: DUF2442 domain-containing protein [Clostridia bacterium]